MPRLANSFLLFIAALFMSGPAFAGEIIEGTATAVGGDMLRIGDKTIYLNGVVAPRGAGSDFALASLLKKGVVKCSVQAKSQGSKPTALCKMGNKNISAELVSVGAAVLFVENDSDLSSHLLQEHPVVAGLDEGLTPPRDCLIKGNKSQAKAGNLIYHMPGDVYYLRTKIDVSRDEAWFCSEVDAKAAGFRRAGW